MAGVKGQRSGGHNAKPVALHRLQGTFRKHRHSGHTTAEPPLGHPPKPAGLTGEAAEEWGRMLARLVSSQTLSAVDDGVLARYCKLHARAERLEAALADEPPFFDKVSVDGAGQEHVERKVHPGFAQCRQYDLALRVYLVEFGLTPASRGRVTLPRDGPPTKSKLERFLDGKATTV